MPAGPDGDAAAGSGPHGDRPATYDTRIGETDAPASLDALRATARKLPGGVCRCRGIVRDIEAPERTVILQVVGRRVDISLLGSWEGREQGTRIVATGAPGSIDAADLRRRVDACIVA